MSATRLLILGCMRWMQPTHGYDIRRELESWRAEEWANIAYGSIYFALNKLAEEGLIAISATDRVGKRPARTVYTLTEHGEIEFQRLLREFWWNYKPAIDPFLVAVSFMDQLPPEELSAALRHRAQAVRVVSNSFVQQATAPIVNDYKPRHVAELLRLMTSRIESEAGWAEAAAARVDKGELP